MDAIYGISKRNHDDNNLLENLYQVPKKDSSGEMAHVVRGTVPNFAHMADLLFLPNDHGYKYALVVVDTNTRKVDAEPLKTKSSKNVLKAFQKIYKRGILKTPERILTDPGSEFKGDVKKYFENEGVVMRYGDVNRHRQQTLAERANRTIGTAIMRRQTAQELLTKEPSLQWIQDLPEIIKTMNSRKIKVKKYPDYPTSKGDILPIGTKVRLALDTPVSVSSGKREHGGFRAGDIKFDPTIREIKHIEISPGQPIMYLLNGNSGLWGVHPTQYTRNQLQLVREGEKLPNAKLVIRGKSKRLQKLIKDSEI